MHHELYSQCIATKFHYSKYSFALNFGTPSQEFDIENQKKIIPW